MTDQAYPFGTALMPEAMDEHTVILLVRPEGAPAFDEDELDRLQAAHLAHLRELARRGVLVANGPLSDQTDERIRGISIYALPLEEALALARADPMVHAGRLAIEGGRWSTASETVRFGPGRR